MGWLLARGMGNFSAKSFWMFDMEIDLSELDAIVLDKKIGVDIGWSPILLSSEKFIDLLNSGKARNSDLNNIIHAGSPDYFHTANYLGVDFLCYGPGEIYDV